MEDFENTGPLSEELQRRIRDAETMRYVEEARSRQRRLKANRLALFTSLALLSAVGLFSLLGFRLFTLDLVGIILALVGLAAAAFTYLQPSSTRREGNSSTRQFEELRFYFEHRLNDALGKLDASTHKPIDFTEQEKTSVLKSIQAKLESDALEGYAKGIRKLVLAQVRQEAIDERLQSSRTRLSQEVQDLAKRGNVNLVLGMFTTLAGLGLLGYAVFNPPIGVSMIELAFYFAPRVSLVLLIEIFAYFFLKLYKQSLAEIKYFQNEVTNIESKHVALQVALRADDQALRSKVVEALVATERNFILLKDQTTVDLERERLLKEQQLGLTSTLKDLLKRKNDA